MENKSINIGNEIIFYNTVDSTNDEAKRLAVKKEVANGTVLISSNQTKGKGRIGKEWVDEKNNNLAFSTIIFAELENKGILSDGIFSLAVGLACLNTIKHFVNENVFVKWPNDIIVRDKKVSGILIETSIKNNEIDFVVLGIGINVNNNLTSFSGEIINKATSLFLQTGKILDLDEVVKILVVQLNIVYQRLLSGEKNEIRNEYKKICLNLGKEVKAIYKGRELVGKVIDINHKGYLVLETSSGETVEINSGEASIRNINGEYI